MNYTGIGLVERPKIMKIVHAVQLAELASLYGALRGTDDTLRKSFAVFLVNNPVPGAPAALQVLSTTIDPITAVRAAAVCLLAARIEGEDLDGT